MSASCLSFSVVAPCLAAVTLPPASAAVHCPARLAANPVKHFNTPVAFYCLLSSRACCIPNHKHSLTMQVSPAFVSSRVCCKPNHNTSTQTYFFCLMSSKACCNPVKHLNMRTRFSYHCPAGPGTTQTSMFQWRYF